MPENIILNGITWNHSRGITPLLATSQRFSELHPGVTIQWKKRSLQEFADFPIEEIAKHHDLLIIDHPWVGCASATNCVLPLDEHLPASYLQNQLENSVGGSHESYQYDGHQWALAIDAATPAASYRKDIFEQENTPLPATWEEVLQLAQKGKVAAPAIPIDLLMNFYTFCIAAGQAPFQQEDEVVDAATGRQALETMAHFYRQLDSKMFAANPIAVAEMMSSTNDYWYCPFAYGYSNYSRQGYAKYLLHYTDVVEFNGAKLRTTIGGTGLAVSTYGKQQEMALQFAQMVCSPQWQAGIYAQNGGQPGHLNAWQDPMANSITANFFTNVLPTMQNGYIRPRYNGYLHFQDRAGEPLHQYLSGKTDNVLQVLDSMNQIYRHSLQLQSSLVP